MVVLFEDYTDIFVPEKTYTEAVVNASRVLKAVSKYMWSNKLHIDGIAKLALRTFLPKELLKRCTYTS